MDEKKPPSGEQLEKFFEKDVACWEIAIQRLDIIRKTESKRKKKSKKLEGNNLTSNSVGTTPLAKVESVQDLIRAAQTAHFKLVGSRGKFGEIFHKIVSCLDRNSQVIDVCIQQEPKTTALIWGPIRFLLQVIMDSEKATEITVDGIFLVVQHTGRWSRMAQCFGDLESVKEALVQLYVQVLDFLQCATKRFQKKSLARVGKSVYTSAKDKFATKLTKLKEAADLFDKTAQWESIEDNKRTNKKILSLVSTPNAPAPVEERRKMAEALAFYESKREEFTMNLNIGEIIACIKSLANPIAARPDGLAVTDSGSLPKWFKDNHKYQGWLGDNSPKLLWVVGKAGCGKSALADQTRAALSETKHNAISHAFQSNVSTRKRGRTSLAASILSQLLPPSYPVTDCQKRVFTQLIPLCNQYKSRFEDCPFEQLWPLCTSLLTEERDFYLVIDALDECSLDHSRQATGLLKHISDLLDPAGGKTIIFSRPSHLLGVGTTSEVPLDEIRIIEEDTRSEIAAFCDSAAARLSVPKEMQLQVASRARSGARGSFLWVNLLLKELQRIRAVEEFQKTLNGFPDDCWGVYTKVWKEGLKGLDENDRSDCENVLLLLLGTHRQFELGELDDALGLIPDSAQFIVSTLCQPLVQVIDGRVQLSHTSVRDFLLNGKIGDIGFSASEPDATLARRCLEFLLRDEYAQKDRIGQLLRRNLGYGGSAHDKESGFYEYAARNWNIHLTALSSPDPDLLRLAGSFLRSPQFAYWAEYSITDVGDFQAIRSTEISLTIWSKTLPSRDRSLLDLDNYFELPYTTLNRSYKDNNDDKILQWLTLMHLGFYYFDKGRINEMADVRKDVATGLSELLGRRHPLALQGASDATYTFLFNGQLKKAQRLYAEVAKDQRKVVDEDNPSPFFTEVFQAQAEYLMMEYSTSLSTLTDAMAGFIRTTGPQSNGYLVGQLWYAVAHASAGNTEQAIKMLEFVRDKRKEQYGPEDSFGIATQVFAGDLYRKLKVEENALENIKPALDFRRGFWPISHFLTLDTALVLAITYRDFWKDDKAAEIIGELERDAKLDQKQNFIRACQVKHMRALLLFEDGNIDQSIRILEAFLIEIGSERNNRAVYWIRLDLATMLRYRAGEGDAALASSLFDGIVVDQTDDPEDEPDPPRWLETAEDALKLLRFDKVTEAKKVLQEENLRWAREETLWMWLGVPAADTGWMRLPQGLGSDGSPNSFGWVKNL
ncbi:hypothetical protein KAF25_007919 [Fusarium avenaceum]|uniref:NACHT domain-containing protein n=1 Tax=Fusarium avenaceum TaxID=40199 RepID=A0A9P7KSY3_9HYPO|nr:hypothetical protein KAF25_007919 [Fusarium avenaceum]